MINLSGVYGKDIALCYDLKTGIGIVIDKVHNITYKGLVSSLKLRTEFRHIFSGESFPATRFIDVSLEDYEVISDGADKIQEKIL